MAKADPQAPATKQDIAMLMDQMGKILDTNERWKDELKEEVAAVESRLLVAMEQLRGDVRSMYHDKWSQHEDRIVRLERHAGLRAA